LLVSLVIFLGDGENGPRLLFILLVLDVLGLGEIPGMLTGSVDGGLFGNGVSVRGL